MLRRINQRRHDTVQGAVAYGTVQGAVATWRSGKRLLREHQVATAPCTVPPFNLDRFAIVWVGQFDKLSHRLEPLAAVNSYTRPQTNLVKALILLTMVIGLSASLSPLSFGQELQAAQQFVQSATSSDAAQKLLREGRELIGERKWAAATAKFNDLVQAYPRDKNLDAALYWLAFCLKQQGRPLQADRTLERLIKEYPRSEWNDDARALRIELAEVLGNLDAARKALEREKKIIERDRKTFDDARQRMQESRARMQEVRQRMRENRERMQVMRERNQRASHTDDSNEAVKLIALQSLFKSDPERAMSVAVVFFSADSKTSPAIQDAALGLIARHGGEKAWPALADAAGNQSIAESIREQAIYWLAQSNETRAQAEIVEVARSNNSPELRDRAIYWIARRKGDEATDSLIRLYDEQKEEEIKERILYWLGQRGGKAGLQKLFTVAMSDPSLSLRERAVYYLSRSKDPEALKLLEQILK